MTREDAARFIAGIADPIGQGRPSIVQGILDGSKLNLCYRAAAIRLHPDRGGKTEDFQRLQEAKQVLDL